MAKLCIFCRSSKYPITKEHVVADWISKLYPDLGDSEAEIVRRDGSMIKFSVGLFQQTVRVPCSWCNNNWMSGLESSVKGTLGPMITEGRPTILSAPQQTYFAKWAVKTAFMMEFLHPSERIVPDSEYQRFYERQMPPVGYVVWLAHRRTLVDATGRTLLAMSREEPINTLRAEDEVARVAAEDAMRNGSAAYVITFAIGHAVFQVFGHTFPRAFRISASMEGVTRWIWPVLGDVKWPPPHSIDDIGGLDALHDAFKAAPTSLA